MTRYYLHGDFPEVEITPEMELAGEDVLDVLMEGSPNFGVAKEVYRAMELARRYPAASTKA